MFLSFYRAVECKLLLLFALIKSHARVHFSQLSGARKSKSEIDQLIVTSQSQNVYNWVQNWKPTNAPEQIAVASLLLIERKFSVHVLYNREHHEGISEVHPEWRGGSFLSERWGATNSTTYLLFLKVMDQILRPLWLRNPGWWN